MSFSLCFINTGCGCFLYLTTPLKIEGGWSMESTGSSLRLKLQNPHFQIFAVFCFHHSSSYTGLYLPVMVRKSRTPVHCKEFFEKKPGRVEHRRCMNSHARHPSEGLSTLVECDFFFWTDCLSCSCVLGTCTIETKKVRNRSKRAFGPCFGCS